MNVKENDGKGARDFRAQLITKIVILVFVVTFLIFLTHDPSDAANYGDVYEKFKGHDSHLLEDIQNAPKVNRHAMKEKHRDKAAFMKNKSLMRGAGKKYQVQSGSREEEMILSGQATLIDFHALNGNNFDAIGTFCEVDWHLHKDDPPSYAMFRSLTERCEKKFSAPLREMAEKARAMDLSGKYPSVKSIPLKGVVFHESRCGSTLVANSLQAFAPEKTRVYSESQPPVSALKLCSSSRTCDEQKHIEFIKDVVFLMGRTNDKKEEFMFFKIQSIGTLNIHKFRNAFPDIPWIFVYRDPVQVMMSHLRSPRSYKSANCNRNYKSPLPETKALIKRISGGSSLNLTFVEYCAAHLATLCHVAHTESIQSGTGKLVEYSSLPGALIDDIIPKYFLGRSTPLEYDAVQNILAVNERYSKGHKMSNAKDWQSDNEAKEKSASEEIKAAATKYMLPTYIAMQSNQR